MRLSPSDFDALQRATLEMHDYRDLKAYRDAVPTIYLKIIPAEWFGLFDLVMEPAANRMDLADFWESSSRFTQTNLSERKMRFGFDHPFTRYSVEHADPTAL